MEKTKKIFKWIGIVLGSAFVLLVVVRAFHFYNLDQINAQVDVIHNTKLQLSDVMGDNLPPDPGAVADDTVVGVDANKNGIRDDVELGIFKKYPNSAKMRAVALQYALALQMGFVQPFVSKEIATEVVREQSRAYVCIGEVFSKKDLKKFDEETDKLTSFVKESQLNNTQRLNFRDVFLRSVGSFSELEQVCDIDYSTLPN